jgi:acyl dehydratase
VTPLYFEDLAVGDRFESPPAPMERAEIVAFARQFDPQPQHMSDESAAASLFGRLIASGWHTGAVTMRLQYEVLLSRFPGGAMGATVERMSWTRPVEPGDAIRAVVEVLAVRESRSRPERGVVSMRTTTLNQRDEAVMDMTAAIMVPRRPPA